MSHAASGSSAAVPRDPPAIATEWRELFASGGAQLVAWWPTRHVGGSWTVSLTGLASVVLGILIWAGLPSSSAWAIGLLVGIEVLLYGMSLIMSALAGRRLAQMTG